MRPSARGTQLLVCPTPPRRSPGSAVLIHLPGTARRWINPHPVRILCDYPNLSAGRSGPGPAAMLEPASIVMFEVSGRILLRFQIGNAGQSLVRRAVSRWAHQGQEGMPAGGPGSSSTSMSSPSPGIPRFPAISPSSSGSPTGGRLLGVLGDTGGRRERAQRSSLA